MFFSFIDGEMMGYVRKIQPLEFSSNIYKHNRRRKTFFGKAKLNGSVTLARAAETWLNYKKTTLVITKTNKQK